MKQLAYRLRKQQADRTIYRIRDPETKMEMQGIEEIKDCFKRYYEKLYSQGKNFTWRLENLRQTNLQVQMVLLRSGTRN